MESKIIYDEKIAKSFHDTRYYEANEFTSKNLEFMEKEKERLSTERKKRVTDLIKELAKKARDKENSKPFGILEKIFKKNQDYAFGFTNIEPINSDLFNLLTNEAILYTSYKKVRRNKGAMTKAAEMSTAKYNTLDAETKSWVNKTQHSPDEINKNVFTQMKKLIKENKYPWGCSRRILVDKPGKKGKKRPITIPPFIDKVVQEATTKLLTAIYEPYFEKTNCSFGFRPNKGVHDAIIPLTGGKAIGLSMALEGDLEDAYGKVSREKFIKIAGEKIKDKNFLKFLETRLNYEYYDTESKKYIKDKKGLPQGGIDSPYMWNIYMAKFDEFVIEHLTKKFKELNERVRTRKIKRSKFAKNRKKKQGVGSVPKRKQILLPEKEKLKGLRSTILKIVKWIRENKKDKDLLQKLEKIGKMSAKQITDEKIITGELNGYTRLINQAQIGIEKDTKKIIKNLFHMSKILTHKIHKLPNRDPNRLELKFRYIRYADDFIILTNAKKDIMEEIKEEISIFLREELSSNLSMEKTLITDIRKKPAHFLGYEIKTYRKRKIERYIRKNKKVKAQTAGYKVFARPDKQRLIDRLHMKGYCDKKGFPREIGFLTFLEDFSIIERYNSVLTGISNYYTEFIKNPKRNLSRWFYIIRYSCIKTLAQKHKTTVRQIFKKYKLSKEERSKEIKTKTIMATVVNIINGEKYIKNWKLKTPEELIKNSLLLKRKPTLNNIRRSIEQGIPVIYTEEDKSNITNDNYLDKMLWINIRTQSSFDLPCAICGSEEDIQMHHLNHVRKSKYNLIDDEKTWYKAMFIRNRKQMPICKECHMTLIHKGKYGGDKLSYIAPKVMYDNRIITIESHLRKHTSNMFSSKTLLERGWKKIEKDKEF